MKLLEKEKAGPAAAAQGRSSPQAPQKGKGAPGQGRFTAFRQQVARFAGLVETLISLIVLAAVIITGARVVVELADLALAQNVNDAFDSFLRNAFNVVIGVEFVKMLAKHSAGSAIEVLLFAIARQMVVEHTTPIENLVSILAILLIFVIRKFLFVSAFDLQEEPLGESLLTDQAKLKGEPEQEE